MNHINLLNYISEFRWRILVLAWMCGILMLIVMHVRVVTLMAHWLRGQRRVRSVGKGVMSVMAFLVSLVRGLIVILVDLRRRTLVCWILLKWAEIAIGQWMSLRIRWIIIVQIGRMCGWISGWRWVTMRRRTHVHRKVDVDVRASCLCNCLILGTYCWLSLRHVIRMMIRPLVGHWSVFVSFLTIYPLLLSLSLPLPLPLSLPLLLLVVVILVSRMILLVHVVPVGIVIGMLVWLWVGLGLWHYIAWLPMWFVLKSFEMLVFVLVMWVVRRIGVAIVRLMLPFILLCLYFLNFFLRFLIVDLVFLVLVLYLRGEFASLSLL